MKMNHQQLAQAINFKDIIDRALPTGYTQGTIDLKGDLTIGSIISAILPLIFVIAGLILFVRLIAAGFRLLTSAGNQETVQKAQGSIITSLTGFLIIFAAYWLTQILEVIFGIQIF